MKRMFRGMQGKNQQNVSGMQEKIDRMFQECQQNVDGMIQESKTKLTEYLWNARINST